MLEGIYVNQVLNHKSVRPYIRCPQETSGYFTGTQAIYRYSLKDSDYPILSLAEPLFDGQGDVIPPGHYELALSDERDFLILMQSKNPRAIIPVFKVEEDLTEQQRINDKKYKKQLKKEEKAREKTNKSRKEAGMPEDEPKIYMEAEIEYQKEGSYYLIKYQRGTIKAWGAFKG
ncbi:MAG: hypothetical protein ACLSWI_07890 [Candidatus Gastranaerophilaceae bacterium]